MAVNLEAERVRQAKVAAPQVRLMCAAVCVGACCRVCCNALQTSFHVLRYALYVKSAVY